MILEAGEFNYQAQFQRRKGETDGSTGEVLDTWIDIDFYWVKISSLTRSNREVARGFASTVTHDGKMNYHREVTNGCRLIAGGVTYYVDGVIHDPSPQKNWTQLFLTALES